MKTFEFTIVATGPDPHAEGFEDRFFEAGCDDATISLQKGVIILEFAREAPTFVRALVSAVLDVMKTQARIERIEPDYLVSLSEIAKRAGVTRAAVSLYATGSRGKDFPPPVARITTESPLWDWVEVARWLYHNRKLGRDAVVQARLVKNINNDVSAAEPEHRILAHRTQRQPRAA